VVALQFTIEATQAHTWKDASTAAKDAALALGTAGMVVAAAFLVRSLQTLRDGAAATSGGAHDE
jgi:hypothetical protein